MAADRVLRHIAGALFIPDTNTNTNTKAMFMHLVWQKHILLELTADRLSMKSTLQAIKVVWPSKNHDHELKVG